jgi:hypothetical protein
MPDPAYACRIPMVLNGRPRPLYESPRPHVGGSVSRVVALEQNGHHHSPSRELGRAWSIICHRWTIALIGTAPRFRPYRPLVSRVYLRTPR